MENLFRRKLNNDDIDSLEPTNQLVDTLYINICLFFVLVFIFECCRHWKSVYQCRRLKSKLVRNARVPPSPSSRPFSWISEIARIHDDEFLKMVGLDAYMLIRYIKALFRIGIFFSFFGIVILTPVYGTAGGGFVGWNKYTLANIPDQENDEILWVPVIFCYVFSLFFCQMMYSEYKNFVQKRVQYLIEDDFDTPPQTNYTIMVERIPSVIKSAPMLAEFFEKLFPGQVYSVEVALDLTELDELTAERKAVRNNLEKAVALFHATGVRPIKWASLLRYCDSMNAPTVVNEKSFLAFCGYGEYDAVEYYSKELEVLNDRVQEMQKEYFEKRKTIDELETYRIHQIKRDLEQTVGSAIRRVLPPLVTTDDGTQTSSKLSMNTVDEPLLEKISLEVYEQKLVEYNKEAEQLTLHIDEDSTTVDGLKGRLLSSASSNGKSTVQQIETGVKLVGNAARSGVGGIAKSGFKTAEIATKGALRGVLEATKTLELLTVGAYYKIASTAFLTFKSRVVACSCYQILLSHEHFVMEISPAPNPKDVIWENVSIPQRQIKSRKTIADGTIIVGAIFWSIVVTFITAVSNLESIAQEFPTIQQYSDTELYKFLNNYLAIGILLILLAILPAIFDFISRNYEGIKLESEIQNLIMARFFNYTLANVYVSVGLGSIAASLHEILSNPASILSILGASVPSFSIYFASLVVIKTFTAVPIEMLRIFPLLEIVIVKMCTDHKKCTRRELTSGVFADTAMAYGWIFPSLLMVLMIMVTYCCIAPLLMPLCALFFLAAYLMYKYQLLYVYINEYQSGGYMWYAVFNRSMVALLCGVTTLLCYLAIRMTFLTGPFYVILPLPIAIWKFWEHCQSRFERPSMSLSLESAIELDRQVAEKTALSLPIPHDAFHKWLFRQPSLAEGRLKPMPYRRRSSTRRKDSVSVSPSRRRTLSGAGGGGGNTLSSSLSSYVIEDEEEDAKIEDVEAEEVVCEMLNEHDNHPQGGEGGSSSGSGGEPASTGTAAVGGIHASESLVDTIRNSLRRASDTREVSTKIDVELGGRGTINYGATL